MQLLVLQQRPRAHVATVAETCEGALCAGYSARSCMLGTLLDAAILELRETKQRGGRALKLQRVAHEVVRIAALADAQKKHVLKALQPLGGCVGGADGAIYVVAKLPRDDDEEAVLGVWGAILWLAVITVFIAFLSEYMVDAMEPMPNRCVPAVGSLLEPNAKISEFELVQQCHAN